MDNNSGMDKEISIDHISEISNSKLKDDQIPNEKKNDIHRFSFCPPEAIMLQKEKLKNNKKIEQSNHSEFIDNEEKINNMLNNGKYKYIERLFSNFFIS